MTDVLHRRARRQRRESYLVWACVILLILGAAGGLSSGGTQAKSVAEIPPPVEASAPEAATPAPARPVRVIAIRGAAPAPVITTR